MWTSTSMTIGESFIASLMGFSIVFCVLAFLAIVVLVFAKIFSGVGGGHKQAAAPAAAAPAVKDESETVAVITSVICEELRADPNELVFKGIREL